MNARVRGHARVVDRLRHYTATKVWLGTGAQKTLPMPQVLGHPHAVARPWPPPFAPPHGKQRSRTHVTIQTCGSNI